MDEALRIFRARGFDLLLAEAAIRSAEGDELTAGAVPNPAINGGVSIAPGYDAALNCPSATPNNPTPPTGCSGFGFQLGVTDNAAIIGDTLAGKRSARLSVARAALAATKMARADAQRLLEFNVKQQYLMVALAKSTLDFSRTVAESSAQTLELNRRRYPAVIDEGALARIETTKFAADNAVDRARQVLRQAQIDLGFFLGIRGTAPEFEVGTEFAGFVVPPRLQSVDGDALRSDLRREAFEHRPDLKALAYQKERASASIALARRQRFPDIALVAQYSQVGTGAAAISPPTFFFGLSAPLPVLYQQQGEIRRAEADLSAQTTQRSKLEAQVASDVDGAFNAFATTRKIMERYSGAGQFLDRARLARDITKKQYEAGSAPLMDYLDAQRTFIATNLDYLQTLTSYWTAVFQLEAAMGMELR